MAFYLMYIKAQCSSEDLIIKWENVSLLCSSWRLYLQKATQYQFPIGSWLPFMAESQEAEPLALSFLYYVRKFTGRRVGIASLGAETQLGLFKLSCAFSTLMRFRKRICLPFFFFLSSWENETHMEAGERREHCAPQGSASATQLQSLRFLFCIPACLSSLTRRYIREHDKTPLAL